MKCEYCTFDHDGTFGSGRFCSVKCARGFSTRKNRKEINERVSKKLTKPPGSKLLQLKICNVCKVEFSTSFRKQICCSKACSAKRRGKQAKEKHLRILEERRTRGIGTGNYVKNPQSLFDLSGRTIGKILVRLQIGCSRCGWDKAPCDLHHIQGKKIENPDHHSNLTYICPNCHRLFHRGKIGRSDVRSLDEQVGERWKEFYFDKQL